MHTQLTRHQLLVTSLAVLVQPRPLPAVAAPSQAVATAAPAIITTPANPPTDDNLFSKTFTGPSLGIELSDAADGRVQVRRVVPGSPASERGVPVLAYLVSVNGQPTAGLSAKETQALVQRASRPLELTFDGSAYAGLPADKVSQKVAEAQGMQTATLRIEKDEANRGRTCGMKSAVDDVIEVEFEASVEATGTVFDSSAQRSGRPFAFLLGNGDVTRGLELGVLEMCIGEERTLRVPPDLGFGSRGSRIFGVPPNAPLVYKVRLVSINMQTDPKVVRSELPDEQRF